MTAATSTRLTPDACQRALDARDARFDGLFFVGITTTRIYCRPVCPARVSYRDRRRFFETAALAERAGFRPCLRCRPELAPGRALIDAVPNLARVAAHRIGAGALNGRAVAHLAQELGVSDRHLRRVLERELGVSPLELAQTHRLLLAKQLLADTALPVTRIAYASGFQSLRRFNAVFHERYRLSPTALRRGPGGPLADSGPGSGDGVRLTLAYRAPFDWATLLVLLGREAVPGVERVEAGRYSRTVRVEGRIGVVQVEDAASAPGRGVARRHLEVMISPPLLPALMPLLARLRNLFDLDAEPSVVEAHLARAGLGPLVRRRPGLRIPGAADGFEAALRALLGRESSTLRRVTEVLGPRFESGLAGLDRLVPDAADVAGAGARHLEELGVAPRRAAVLVSVARALVAGELWLEPGTDVAGAQRALLRIPGIGERLATAILVRALHWPDAFPLSDRTLRRGAGVAEREGLRARAEAWRPWRAYAALHLALSVESAVGVSP